MTNGHMGGQTGGDPDQVKTLGELFFWSVEEHPSPQMLTWQRAGREASYSSAEFESAVLRLAKSFRLDGLQPGDRVAIYAENRPEWHMVDFAAHVAGMVLVPVYPTLAAHQMEHILLHAGVRVVFCGADQMERVQSVRENLPELERAIALDSDFLDALPAVDAAERAEMRARVVATDPETLATIVYTSGTTGTPKGVMLTHANILFDMLSATRRLPEQASQLALSVLPLSHVFERLLSYGYFHRGIPMAYGDPHELRALLNRYHPTVVGVVPRVLEKMREAIEATIALMPAHRQAISKFLLGAGYAHMDRQGGLKSALYPLADLLMFRKVHRQLGGVQFFIVGGAWLNPELERYFRAIGFAVIQGYGLTETSPVIAVNQHGAECTGSVGKAIDGVEIQIDADGEILTRGRHVMRGYFRDPEATAKVFRDGWFLTGDLGQLDAEGHLTITGRRKEMLLLSNGKNIFYAPIEQALRISRFIEQAFVVGEGRNYTALIIVPNLANVREHARDAGIAATAMEELLAAEPVLQLYRQTIEEHQAEFSRYEQVKRFCFLPEEALLDVDLVTPTLKVRRSVLERKYAKFIDRIYREDRPFVIPHVAESKAAEPVLPHN